jgi:uncharacterized damage-inducible protein DinB
MRNSFLNALAAAALSAAPLAAQGATPTMPAMAAKPAAVPTAGYRAEFINNFNTVTDKYVKLAQAIPAEKYTWRPGPGVRSIAEVLLHVAAANYMFGSCLGAPLPAGVDLKTLEKSTTDKAKIVETLKASFAFYNNGVMALADADAEKPITIPMVNMTMTARGFLLFETDHNAEHLGQMIAYARVNGVVPPWSMAPAAPGM